MKANELRVNNIVMYNDVVYTISEFCETIILLDSLTPIPLTEDILLKCGFQKISTNYEKGFLLLWGNLKTGTIDFVLIEPHSNIRHVTALSYLHQLQNLYFALTNEELTINL